ncbi:right-handed parallel beta-helix repeat-containing protein [Halomicrococcus sp. SG-WS-1]|uniref:right-handed parallel beta-helix repeat-containing protein n=1 Tax=Halomicrococcus sp. SG-WS-1 TaxID=3439057 RepID=UPI003F794F71
MKRTIDTLGEGDDGQSNSKRRTFLKGVSAAGLCAAASRGMTGRASAGWSSPYLDDYSTVVNMVEDAGADPNGNEPINPQLEEYAGDDTILVFPPGRYRMNRQFRFTGFDNFGIIGQWNVTLVPDNYHDFDDGDDWNHKLFRLGISYNPGRELLFKNIHVDMTADDTGVRVLEAAISDDMFVDNVKIHGRHDSGAWGPGRFVMTDPDGSGRVRNFRAPRGGNWTSNAPADELWRGPTGILCNTNKGTMTFEDCELGDFPDNGLYAADGSGQVIVDGGTYKNSQTAGIRIGGEDSIVRNATAIVDDARGWGNQHAIRVENSNYVRVQNCDIRVTDPNGEAIKTFGVGAFLLENSRIRTSGGDVVHGLLISDNTDFARIKHTTFEHEAPGGFSLWAQSGADDVHVENCTFVGDGGHESARAAIRTDRDGSVFRDLNVDQRGSSRRRAIEVHGNDCTLVGGKYLGNERALINHGDDTWVENVYADAAPPNEAVLLYDTGHGVYIKKSTIAGGIENRGSEDLKLWANDWSA